LGFGDQGRVVKNTNLYLVIYLAVNLLYNNMVMQDPAIPIKIPAGSTAEYDPNRYNMEPPIYEPATPRAIVLIKPKFSSPGIIALAIDPTKIP
jgi:hypothetical protein